MCIFYAFLCSFSYRGKVIIKGVSNIIGIGYSIIIIKGQYSWYIECYSFQINKGFDSFPCLLNIISISFKIFIIISLLTFLRKGREKISIFSVVSMKFLFWYRGLPINEICNLFFTYIDFCKPKVLQGLGLNFNLYLLIFLEGAQV